MDPMTLLEKLAVPRPNHSETVDKIAAYIRELLTAWDVPFVVQTFALRPHKNMLVAAGVLILALLLFVSVARKMPVFALIFSLAIPALMILEHETHIYTVSRLFEKPGYNIVATLGAPEPRREIIFCAHYDSKTDFFDLLQRKKIYKWIPYAGALGVLLAVWLFLGRPLPSLQSGFLRGLGIGVAGLLLLYWGLVFIAFSGYLVIPDNKSSPGAVDNATSVTALLTLANDIREGRVDPGSSKITFAFFGGEEVGPQGSHHFVRERFGPGAERPDVSAHLVNLELTAQNGPMIYWEKVGVFLRWHPADRDLIERLDKACLEVTGEKMETEKKMISDNVHFAAIGVPNIAIGHNGKPGPGMGGFHGPQDNMERVNPDNLQQMIDTLARYIEGYR